MPLLKLLMSTENKLKRKHGHREEVGSLSKVQKKMDIFFLKEFLKNTESETIEQEQNISLSSKEIISPEPLAFKGFPTNTMTKNSVSVSVSHLKLKQTKSPTIKGMTQSNNQGVTKMNYPNQTLLPNHQEQ